MKSTDLKQELERMVNKSNLKKRLMRSILLDYTECDFGGIPLFTKEATNVKLVRENFTETQIIDMIMSINPHIEIDDKYIHIGNDVVSILHSGLSTELLDNWKEVLNMNNNDMRYQFFIKAYYEGFLPLDKAFNFAIEKIIQNHSLN